MRARMRSPRCIRSRCSAVYAVDEFLGELGLPVDVLSLSALLIPLLLAWRGGWKAALSAVAAVQLVFVHQCAGLENGPLSLGRDFIDEVVMEFPWYVGVIQVIPRLWLLARKGVVQEIDFTASCRSGPFQSWDNEKSVPIGPNQRTLCVKGWLRWKCKLRRVVRRGGVGGIVGRDVAAALPWG